MSTTNRFVKAPGASLDYVWDWRALTHGVPGAVADWLAAGETIVSASVTVPAGLTLDSYTELDGAVTAWISGGLSSAGYPVTCRITTSAGRVDERNIYLTVAER